MFDSPLHWCPLRKDWVALDEGLAECRRRHDCRAATCPLEPLFRELHGKAEEEGRADIRRVAPDL